MNNKSHKHNKTFLKAIEKQPLFAFVICQMWPCNFHSIPLSVSSKQSSSYVVVGSVVSAKVGGLDSTLLDKVM